MTRCNQLVTRPEQAGGVYAGQRTRIAPARWPPLGRSTLGLIESVAQTATLGATSPCWCSTELQFHYALIGERGCLITSIACSISVGGSVV
ncbi:MAG: hypothetical protein LUP91_15015 [Methylococcaceae bacterium]|nr:hypothetical protein [Methylococcaceae bacterium]